MERDEATPSSSGLYGRERGAGGKFRKPSARKPPTTPYDRPPASQPQCRNGGWLSKLVDPAYRLISGGATRIFPSLFSKSPAAIALLPSNTEDHDEWGTEVKQIGNNEVKTDLGSISTEGAGPSKSPDISLNIPDLNNEFRKNKIINKSDDDEFSKIEKLVEGNTFSRDEINHLMEILNSRVVNSSNVEPEKKKQILSTTGEAEGALLAKESPEMSIKENQGCLDTSLWGTSTPLLKSTKLDEVGASPIDIAKAYMGCRASEVDPGSNITTRKFETALLKTGDFASMECIPSPSPKPSVCWPGAMLQEHNYSTPRSERGKYGLHNFPRTPYSRTIYPSSKSKLTQLQAEKSRYTNTSSTTPHHLQTPFHGQVKPHSVMNGTTTYGSLGPIRRGRHKLGSEARPRGSFSPYQNGPPKVENSMYSKEFLPAIKKNLEPGTTNNSTSELQSVESITTRTNLPNNQASSPSKAVRAILEHLDRNKPTPKEISAEMKLATAWKNTPSSSEAVVPKERTSLMNSAYRQFSAQGNHDEATDAVNNNDSEAARTRSGETSLIHDIAGPSSVDLKARKVPMGFGDRKREGTGQLWSSHDQINGRGFSKLIPKPTLANIAVSKPNLKWTVNPENNASSGFTFPISSSTTGGILSEPPTPSIAPSFSATALPQTKEGSVVVPSYTFGTKTSKQALVFSFPSSSSSAPSHDGAASDIKFEFGSSDKKTTRVSFKSVGKDAICY